MSTVPPVPQWTPELAKTSQNDFQSICKLALPQAIGNEVKTTSELVDKSGLLKSPAVMQREIDGMSPPKTLGRFVHFLRCSFCGLESINKTRFDSHLPCSQTSNTDHHYYLHTCSACFACSTSQSLMDEHLDLFHKGIQVELIKTQEVLRPTTMSASTVPKIPRPTSAATNTSVSGSTCRRPVKPVEFPSYEVGRGEDNGCLDLSTGTAASTSATGPTATATATATITTAAASPTVCAEHPKGETEHLKRCHVCGAELGGSVEELTRHLAFVHLIPMPLMLGQLAAMAVGMRSGQNKSSPSSSSSSSSSSNAIGLPPQPPPPIPPPPPPPPPPPAPPSQSLLTLHENIPHGGWDIPSLLAVSNSLGQNSPGERLPQLPFPFGQFDAIPQQATSPPFPLGSKNLFGLNFDLPPLPALEQNGQSGPRNPAASEPDFKRARIEPSLGIEGHPFFSRFSATAMGSQASSSLYPPPPAPPPAPPAPPIPSGLLSRMTFPPISSSQQPSQPLTKVSAKTISEGRARHGEEATAGSATVTTTSTAPPGIVHNTLRKTKSDMKVIHRYLVQVKNDTREIHEIPPQDLCNYIQDFIVTAKKKDGHEYEPESLKAFVHSLERHLKYHNYPHSVLKDPDFAPARLVLSQRLNELRALSQANGSSSVHRNQVDGGKCDFGFSEPHDGNKLVNFNALLQTGLLGPANPQALLNSLWLIVRTQFNVVGTQKHRTLTWGQFHCVTNVNSQDLLRFTSRTSPQEIRFCHGHGGPLGVRIFDGHESGSGNSSAKRQILPFDCVEIFNFYARLRPAECRGPEEPLYLCPDPSWDHGGPWFKPVVAGAQFISRIPRLLGMKPPRDPPALPPISDGTITPLFSNTPMHSLSQLRDNLLATMNSFIADKIMTEASSVGEIPPPPFISSPGGLAPENLSLLSVRIAQFPQQSLGKNEKIHEKGDREVKPTQGWNSPVASSLDSSVDDTSVSSPKSLPAPSALSTSAAVPNHKPTMTP